MTDPSLSVVIAHQEGDVARCVASLGAGADVEVIVVAASPVAVEGARFVSAPSPSLPTLAGAGIAEARAPWIAFTESCFTFGPGWLQRIRAGMEANAVTGGAVEPGDGLNAAELALYLCDYAQFATSEPPPAREVAGCNVVLHKEQLPDASTLRREGFWKTFFLADRGIAASMEREAVVYYGRRSTTGSLIRRRWHHGRCFGAMRGRRNGAAWRAAFLLAGLAAPLLVAWRLARRLGGSKRFRGQALRVSPWILLAVAAWGAGEWAGNLAGAGRSCERL